VILAAGVKELADEYVRLGSPKPGEPPSLFASGDNVMNLLAGTAASALVGYAAIAFLLRFLQQNSTAVFVAYRLLLGTAILGMLAAGLLK
jgi:undecaprenyl-diphosphatase